MVSGRGRGNSAHEPRVRDLIPDFVAIARVSKNEELAELVTSDLGTVDGIEATETLIAFRSYSRHDLERMFSIGMEN